MPLQCSCEESAFEPLSIPKPEPQFPTLNPRPSSPSPAFRAEIPTTLETLIDTQQQEEEEENSPNSPLTRLLGSKSEAVGALKSLLQEKLESGEDEEALSILKKLSSAQPDNLQWKFLIARVSNELGKISEARDAFEEILARNPLSFEALFKNPLVIDRAGERDTVMNRLEEALRFAEDAKKSKEARDMKLIMAQMKFLPKNIEQALNIRRGFRVGSWASIFPPKCILT